MDKACMVFMARWTGSYSFKKAWTKHVWYLWPDGLVLILSKKHGQSMYGIYGQMDWFLFFQKSMDKACMVFMARWTGSYSYKKAWTKHVWYLWPDGLVLILIKKAWTKHVLYLWPDVLVLILIKK